MLSIPWQSESLKCAVKTHEAAYKKLDQVLRDLAAGRAICKLDRKKNPVIWVKGVAANTRARQYYNKLLKELGSDSFCSLPPQRLHEVCGNMKKWERTTTVPKSAKRVLEGIYDYGRFGKGLRPSYDMTKGVLKWEKDPKGWDAWSYIKVLDVRSCVYCNADSVFAIEVSRGKEKVRKRSACDHFYGHSKYPFAGITLSNLIPSCTRCNTNIKGSREFDKGKYVYPYEDSFHEGARFAVAYAPGKGVTMLDVGDVAIGIVADQRTGIGRKAAKSAKFFCLPEVYNQLHREDALAVVQRELMYSESYREFLRSKYPGVENRVFDRIQNGMCLDPDAINKHNLAKMIRDVVSQFRVIEK